MGQFKKNTVLHKSIKMTINYLEQKFYTNMFHKGGAESLPYCF